MARHFTNASSQYLSGGPDFELGASWGFSATITIDSDVTMVLAGRRNVPTTYGWQIFRGSTNDDLTVTYFGTAAYSSNAGVLTSGNAYRIGVRASSGTVFFYVDGVAAGTASVGTYNAAGAGFPLFIGNRNDSGSPSAFYWDGSISEVALWSSDPGAAAMTSIGKGYSPLIRPQGLAHYWRLLGRQNPEPAQRGGFPLTLVNAPTQASHPRVIHPIESFWPQTLPPTIVTVGLATETDTAQTVTPAKLLLVGLATETDTAQALTVTKLRSVGLALEAATALPITVLKLRDVGLATETDSAFSVTPIFPSSVVGLCGDVSVYPVLAGSLEVSSALDGAVTVQPTLNGAVDLKRCH